MRPSSLASTCSTIALGGGFTHRTPQRKRTGRYRTAGDINRRTLLSQRQRDALADTATGAGDDGDFSNERTCSSKRVLICK